MIAVIPKLDCNQVFAEGEFFWSPAKVMLLICACVALFRALFIVQHYSKVQVSDTTKDEQWYKSTLQKNHLPAFVLLQHFFERGHLIN